MTADPPAPPAVPSPAAGEAACPADLLARLADARSAWLGAPGVAEKDED